MSGYDTARVEDQGLQPPLTVHGTIDGLTVKLVHLKVRRKSWLQKSPGDESKAQFVSRSPCGTWP